MSRGSTSDEQLMANAAAGDRGALDQLVRRYASSLLTYLERMTNDHHTAEELFQEVFLRVWLKRSQYKLGKPFRSWLFAIATNCGRAAFRKAKVTSVSFASSEDVPEPVADQSPVSAAVSTETAAIVAAAVAQLPRQQRTVVVLRIWNGLSHAEIAQSIGCGETTVRSHLHHGMNSMRRFLEPKL